MALLKNISLIPVDMYFLIFMHKAAVLQVPVMFLFSAKHHLNVNAPQL